MDKWEELRKHYKSVIDDPDGDADEVLFAMEVLDRMDDLEQEINALQSEAGHKPNEYYGKE